MDKKRIGIDIDDTILNTSTVYNKYVKKFCDENCIDYSLVSKNSTVRNQIMQKYLKDIYTNLSIKEEFRKIKDTLSSKYDIYFLTARTVKKFPIIKEITEETLKRNNIEYHSLIFTSKNKLKECKKYKIYLMIDDNIDIYNELEKNGINVLLYDENSKYPSLSNRIESWKKVNDYINKFIGDE